MGVLIPATGFDTFLYASIGQDKNGVPLSMLSVFARRDADPWDEAAKLCQLPKASALSTIAEVLDAGAPHPLDPDDQALRAARLFALLPSSLDTPLEFRTLLRTTLSNKRHASIAYGVAIILLFFGLAWFNA